MGGARVGGLQAEDGRPLRLRHRRRAGVVPALPSILRVAILSSSDAFSNLTSVACVCSQKLSEVGLGSALKCICFVP